MSKFNVLGFQRKLERNSQLDANTNWMKKASYCLDSEVKFMIEDLRSASTNSDQSLNPKSEFLLRQLELNLSSVNARRYSSTDILQALKTLFGQPFVLRAYKTLRDHLTLPCPNTLKCHLGGLGSLDAYDCHNSIETN